MNAPDPRDLDPVIRETVMRLRDAGFETTCSCQGGPGHPFERLRAWCRADLVACTVSIHYLCQADRVMPESFVQVEFWTEEETSS